MSSDKNALYAHVSGDHARMNNLTAALDWLKYNPDDQLFLAYWNPQKKQHVGLSRWGQPDGTTNDPEVLKTWYHNPGMKADWPVNPNKITQVYFCLAMTHGKTHKRVIDVDTKNDKDGMAILKKLWAKHGMFPPTYISKTPSGGRHYFFEGICARGVNKLGKGLDIPVMVPVPGSVTEKGPYTPWVADPPCEIPTWIIRTVGEQKEHTFENETYCVGPEIGRAHV